MKHVTDDGILCVHLSHKFLFLSRPLAAIGVSLNLDVMRGIDLGDWDYLRSEVGHYTSDWLLLTRSPVALEQVCDPHRTPRHLVC